jgi:TonB family protein
MAGPAVYRLPRRFITFPEDPRPYGLLAVSLLGHLAGLGAAVALSAFTQLDESKVYIVNLVPASPSLGSPAPPAPPAPAVKAPAAPRPAPPAPKAPPPEEKAPPKAARPDPPPRPERVPERPPERAPEKPVERVVEPPPPREVLTARPKTLEPSELALPRRVEKETPALPPPSPRPVERTLPPPPPVSPPASAPVAPREAPRLPEPPRIAAPPTAPATPAAPTTAPAPPPAVASARSGVEPMRLGRPNATSTSTGSIAVDASDFPFTYYLRLIQSKIGERWAPPRAAAAGGERVVVLFEIQRDGQVREPQVERSSGNSIYDQSAVRAVLEASPFPPLPPEFKASSLRVHFGFEFQPGQG